MLNTFRKCTVVFFIYFFVSLIATNYSLQCKGYANENVDWFIMYKLPKLSQSNDSSIRQGVAFLYMTNNQQHWIRSKVDITSQKSILGYTLAPIYKDNNSSNTLWFLYNDQPPNKPYSAKYGHAKGVVMVNKNEGFWLIHSVPKFPPVPNSGISKGKTVAPDSTDPPEGKYGYPNSGTQYGQTFMCISSKNTQFNEIGQQLMYNQIIVYRRKIPEKLSLNYANLTAAALHKRIKIGPFNRMTSISSINGTSFVSFAKSDKWNKDLYDDFVAPKLKTDLWVESWLNGPDKLPSECNGTKVMNIDSVYFKLVQTSFKSSHDHSKWAVQSKASKHYWVCIGDINRAQTQYNRGGGAVCQNNSLIWQAFNNVVYNIEPCPRRRL